MTIAAGWGDDSKLRYDAVAHVSESDFFSCDTTNVFKTFDKGFVGLQLGSCFINSDANTINCRMRQWFSARIRRFGGGDDPIYWA